MDNSLFGRVAAAISGCIDYMTHKLWLLSFVSLFLMMLLTTVDVFGRYFFKHPVRDALEITQFLLVVTVASAMGYTQILKGHIVVDLVTANFSPGRRKVFTASGNLLCLLLFVLFSWQAYRGAVNNWTNGITIGSYDLPQWPFYAFLAFGCLVASLAFFSDLLKLFLSEDHLQ